MDDKTLIEGVRKHKKDEFPPTLRKCTFMKSLAINA